MYVFVYMYVCVLSRIIPESLPWLLSKGRIAEAEAIVQRAARFNNKQIPTDIFSDHVVGSPSAEAIKVRTSCLQIHVLHHCFYMTFWALFINIFIHQLSGKFLRAENCIKQT